MQNKHFFFLLVVSDVWYVKATYIGQKEKYIFFGGGKNSYDRGKVKTEVKLGNSKSSI